MNAPQPSWPGPCMHRLVLVLGPCMDRLGFGLGPCMHRFEHPNRSFHGDVELCSLADGKQGTWREGVRLELGLHLG